MYRMVLLSLVMHFLQRTTVVNAIEDSSGECRVTCNLKSERAVQYTSVGAPVSVRGKLIR